MTESSSILTSAAWNGVMVPVLVIVAGMVVWLFGHRVLRAALATVGLVAGGAMGWVLGLALQGIVPLPAWSMVVISALTLACAGALGYRLAVTGLLMAVLGLAGPLTVWTVADLQLPAFEATWPAGTGEEAPDDGSDEDEGIDDALLAEADVPGVEAPEGFARRWAENLRAATRQAGLDDAEMSKRIGAAHTFTERCVTWLTEAWSETPPRMRSNIVGTAVIGLLVGLLVGTVLPVFSASLVTSAGGSLLWLVAAFSLADRAGWTASGWVPSSPVGWSLCWIGAAVIGLWIQWMQRRRKADKSG